MKQNLTQKEILTILANKSSNLDKIIQQENSFFSKLTCPLCNSDVSQEADSSQPFREGDILPKSLARCSACSALFDPITGLIHERPTFTNVEKTSLYTSNEADTDQ